MGKSQVKGKPGVTFDLGSLPNGSAVSYSVGLDVGVGETGKLGADLEVTWDSEVQGPNFSVSGSGGGLIGTGEFAFGYQGARLSANGGLGGVAGVVVNVEHVSGVRVSVGYDWWEGKNLSELSYIEETSVGMGLLGKVTVYGVGLTDLLDLFYVDPIDVYTDIAAVRYPGVPREVIEDLISRKAAQNQDLTPQEMLESAARGGDILDQLEPELSRLQNISDNLASRPGHIDHSQDPLDLSSQPHSTPKPGYSVTSPTGYSSRDPYAEEGAGARGGGGNDHDPGDNRDSDRGDSGNNNTGDGGGYDSSAGGGHGDTSSFGGDSGRPSGDRTPPSDVSTHDPHGNGVGAQPIILDLDGNGIEITDLTKSTQFVDATGDGLQNRTAWAGAGDGVLFYDPDGLGEITEKRQYVFTEWGPTATAIWRLWLCHNHPLRNVKHEQRQCHRSNF